MANNKLIVAGASGLTGSAILERFSNRPEWSVVGISRRTPAVPLGNTTHLSVDLLDAAACRKAFGAMTDVTHVAFAALNERDDDIFAGWQDDEQIDKNARLLSNLLDPIIDVAPRLRHVTLVHGGKAYGGHLPERKLPVPLHETLPRHEGRNFYHEQEDYVRARCQGKGWDWTVLRPQAITGVSTASNMNVFLALAVFAALCREAGQALPFPAGNSLLTEPTDAALIAEAVEWSMNAPTARNEIFNLTNGDIFTLKNVFAITAEAMGVPLGEVRPYRFNDEFWKLAPLWPAMVDKYDLHMERDLRALFGTTMQLAESLTMDVPAGDVIRNAGLLSTIKIRKAGFASCEDSANMYARYISRFRALRMIP